MTKPKSKSRLGYAVGGPVIGSISRFFKSPDVYRTGVERSNYDKTSKTGELAKPVGDSKSKAPVKPRTKR